MSNEVADLAAVATRLIKASPENRRIIAELAAILGFDTAESPGGARFPAASSASSVLPFLLTSMKALLERVDERQPMGLPSAEQALWEDAGASFEVGAGTSNSTTRGRARSSTRAVIASLPIDAVRRNAISAAAAFGDLLRRSVEGDSAVASLLGVDRSRVSQRIRDRSLYAFSRADTRYFPRWQFADGGTLPGLREVVSVLDIGLHPLVVDHWFTTPSIDLEIGEAAVSPVTWLGTSGNPRLPAELAADL